MFLGIFLSLFAVFIAKQIHTLPFPPFYINGFYPIDTVIIAILLGILLGNLSFKKEKFTQGIKFSSNYFLQIAIILLGVKLDFSAILAISGKNLFIIISSISLIFFILYIFCKKIKLDKELALLITAGTAICGGAAIAIVAKAIKAKESNITISIATVTLFGTIAIFLYPAIGQSLNISEQDFGILSGVAVHSVPQAMSTAMIYSETSLEYATITKLIRVLMIIPIIIIINLKYKNCENNKICKLVPPFILGFILISILNSLSLFNYQVTDNLTIKTILSNISSYLLLSALFAIGFNTKIKELIKLDKKIFLLGLIMSVSLFIFAYLGIVIS